MKVPHEIPVIEIPHEPQLVGDVGAAVGVRRAHDVLEHLVLALQHGAVVRGAREERAVHFVPLLHYLAVVLKVILRRGLHLKKPFLNNRKMML